MPRAAAVGLRVNGHFSLNELRGAVESISGAGIEAGSLVFSPVLPGSSEGTRTN